MLADAIKEEGLEPLVSTLSRLGGWPMITDKWDEQKYSWQKVDDDYMRLTGRNTFHDVRIDKDDTTVVQVLTAIHSAFDQICYEEYNQTYYI